MKLYSSTILYVFHPCWLEDPEIDPAFLELMKAMLKDGQAVLSERIEEENGGDSA